MSSNLVGQAPPVVQAQAALADWEAEGGALLASLRMPQGESQHDLLERLGAAVVGEWNELPMLVRRSLFERAARLATSHDHGPLRARLARFLHDR